MVNEAEVVRDLFARSITAYEKVLGNPITFERGIPTIGIQGQYGFGLPYDINTRFQDYPSFNLSNIDRIDLKTLTGKLTSQVRFGKAKGGDWISDSKAYRAMLAKIEQAVKNESVKAQVQEIIKAFDSEFEETLRIFELTNSSRVARRSEFSEFLGLGDPNKYVDDALRKSVIVHLLKFFKQQDTILFARSMRGSVIPFSWIMAPYDKLIQSVEDGDLFPEGKFTDEFIKKIGLKRFLSNDTRYVLEQGSKVITPFNTIQNSEIALFLWYCYKRNWFVQLSEGFIDYLTKNQSYFDALKDVGDSKCNYDDLFEVIGYYPEFEKGSNPYNEGIVLAKVGSELDVKFLTLGSSMGFRCFDYQSGLSLVELLSAGDFKIDISSLYDEKFVNWIGIRKKNVPNAYQLEHLPFFEEDLKTLPFSSFVLSAKHLEARSVAMLVPNHAITQRYLMEYPTIASNVIALLEDISNE